MNKRKRHSILFSSITTNDKLGKNFWDNLVHGLPQEYAAGVNNVINIYSFASECIINNSLEKKAGVESITHSIMFKNALIELTILLDNSINNILFHYQWRCKNLEPTEIVTYSSPEDAMNNLLKDVNLSQEFQSLRTQIYLFRILRNQFAHYPMGSFYFSAKQDNFESFLQKLDGILLNSNYHCLLDGKPGVHRSYQITSQGFVNEFTQKSFEFLKLLVKLTFVELNPYYEK